MSSADYHLLGYEALKKKSDPGVLSKGDPEAQLWFYYRHTEKFLRNVVPIDTLIDQLKLILDGQTDRKRKDVAFKMLIKSAEQKNVDAMAEVGFLYKQIDYVRVPRSKEDFKFDVMANELLMEAAAKGSLKGQLGVAFIHIQEGNFGKANEIIQKVLEAVEAKKGKNEVVAYLERELRARCYLFMSFIHMSDLSWALHTLYDVRLDSQKTVESAGRPFFFRDSSGFAKAPQPTEFVAFLVKCISMNYYLLDCKAYNLFFRFLFSGVNPLPSREALRRLVDILQEEGKGQPSVEVLAEIGFTLIQLSGGEKVDIFNLSSKYLHRAALLGHAESKIVLAARRTYAGFSLPPFCPEFKENTSMITNFAFLTADQKEKEIQRVHRQGIDWLTDAANSGHYLAQYGLGFCYESGLNPHILQDTAKALHWYEVFLSNPQLLSKVELLRGGRLSEGSSIDSTYRYSASPMENLSLIKQMIVDALDGLLRIATSFIDSQKGDPVRILTMVAQAEKSTHVFGSLSADVDYAFGRCYELGLLVSQPGLKTDVEKAKECYQRGAANGSQLAKRQLENPAFTLEMRISNALSGDFICQVGLFLKCIQDGKISEASQWGKFIATSPSLKSTSVLGSLQPSEIFSLAECFEEGKGMSADLNVAQRFYILIASNGAQPPSLLLPLAAKLSKCLRTSSTFTNDIHTFDSSLLFEMGKCFESSKEKGVSLLEDCKKALALYGLSQQRGDQRGNPASISPSFAIKWAIAIQTTTLDLSIEDISKLDPTLIHNIAKCFEMGTSPVAKSPAIAVILYRTSASKGHKASQDPATAIFRESIIPSLFDDTVTKDLDLSYTNLDDRDLVVLHKMLMVNSTVVGIDVGNTLMTPATVVKMVESITRRPTELVVKHTNGTAVAFASSGSPSDNVHSPQDAKPRSESNVGDAPPKKRSMDFDELKHQIARPTFAACVIQFEEISIGKRVGNGGFGVVYQGEWRKTAVAVKELSGNISDELTEEFKREAEIMSRLQSQYLIRLYGICLSPKYCLVMEFASNGSLYSFLHSKSPVSWPLRYRLCRDISCGLLFLHKEGILHRDIKSLNVLLDKEYHTKLTDFGLSKIKSESRSTTTSADRVGTLAWMAPELFSRKSTYTQKCDIYSLGVLFWEITTRKRPFHDAVDPAMISVWISQGEREEIPDPPECPEDMKNLIEWCWKQKADQRPSIEQVVERLEKLQSQNVEEGTIEPSTSKESSSTSLVGIDSISLHSTASGGQGLATEYVGNLASMQQ